MTERFSRQQGSASDYIARNTRALRRHAVAPGGFDPNENPVIIGAGATAGGGSTPGDVSLTDGADNVVIGPNANATGADGSIGIGLNSFVNGVNGAVCIGQFTEVDSASGVALGDSAYVFGDGSAALGPSTSTGADSSVAIGFGASSTIDGQICLGRDNRHFVEVRKYSATYGSIVVMQSPNGTRYALQVSNAGALSVIASPV